MLELKRWVFCITVVVLYLKFVVQMILDEQSLLLDCILYVSLLFLLVQRKITFPLVIIFLTACISAINPAAKNIFLIFGLTYASRIYSMKRLLVMNICIQLLVFILTCFMLYGGITHSEMFMQTAIDQRERWDFGYGNPNTFAMFINSIIVNVYLYIHDKKYVGIALILFFVAVMLPVYNYTQSRSYLLASLILIIVHFVLRWKRLFRFSLKMKYILYVIPPVVLMLILTFAKNVGEYRLLNLILSGRLALYRTLVEGISLKEYLFGTPLVSEGETIDNAYLHMLLEGGILGFFVFYYLYYMTIKRMHTEALYILPVLLSFLGYGLTESVFTAVLYVGNLIIWFLMYKISFSMRYCGILNT